ncbi:MAG TPA: hypothetical protein VJ870_09625 [Amycolatopsis sp.]|nr:hypothetical protein [Amycolatopsis sp.]
MGETGRSGRRSELPCQCCDVFRSRDVDEIQERIRDGKLLLARIEWRSLLETSAEMAGDYLPELRWFLLTSLLRAARNNSSAEPWRELSEPAHAH